MGSAQLYPNDTLKPIRDIHSTAVQIQQLMDDTQKGLDDMDTHIIQCIEFMNIYRRNMKECCRILIHITEDIEDLFNPKKIKKIE